MTVPDKPLFNLKAVLVCQAIICSRLSVSVYVDLDRNNCVV